MSGLCRQRWRRKDDSRARERVDTLRRWCGGGYLARCSFHLEIRACVGRAAAKRHAEQRLEGYSSAFTSVIPWSIAFAAVASFESCGIPRHVRRAVGWTDNLDQRQVVVRAHWWCARVGDAAPATRRRRGRLPSSTPRASGELLVLSTSLASRPLASPRSVRFKTDQRSRGAPRSQQAGRRVDCQSPGAPRELSKAVPFLSPWRDICASWLLLVAEKMLRFIRLARVVPV